MSDHAPTIEGGAVPLAAHDGLVVVVTPTILDGTVVRWYSGLDMAEQRRELASASRSGVLVHVYLHQAAGIIDVLNDTHQRLARHPATPAPT